MNYIDSPTLSDLNAHVKPQMCAKWYDVGLALSITEGKLTEIQANNPNDVGKCCRQMFSHWLQKDVHASWEKLMTALESPGVDHNSLAKFIRCKLIPGMLRPLIVNFMFQITTRIAMLKFFIVKSFTIISVFW